MTKVKLSIIIPIYNAQEFIVQCLISLLNQNIDEEEYEIICVNDGSTDESGKICLEFKKNHSNLIYLVQENMGLSYSRNLGLDNSNGEYIWFVDADDMIQENCMKQLIDELYSKNLDLIEIKYERSDDEQIFKNNNRNDILVFVKIKIHSTISAWSKIIKKDILVKNKIIFPVGISSIEDYIWNLKLKHYVFKCEKCNQTLYFYRFNKASIMNNYLANEWCITNHFKLFDLIKRGEYEVDYIDFQFIIKWLLWRILNSKFSFQEQKELVEFLVNNKYYPYKYYRQNLYPSGTKFSVRELKHLFNKSLLEILLFGFKSKKILFASFYINKILKKSDKIDPEYIDIIKQIHNENSKLAKIIYK